MFIIRAGDYWIARSNRATTVVCGTSTLRYNTATKNARREPGILHFALCIV
jgi:hypothetical protein